jgi:hypothetical protein
LKSLTKWLSSDTPTFAITSLTLRKVVSRSFFARRILSVWRYLAGDMPISALNKQWRREGERLTSCDSSADESL